jgi:hypothetical protein
MTKLILLILCAFIILNESIYIILYTYSWIWEPREARSRVPVPKPVMGNFDLHPHSHVEKFPNHIASNGAVPVGYFENVYNTLSTHTCKILRPSKRIRLFKILCKFK